MNEFIYYLNGSYLPASQAALPMNDLGVVRGYGVFDVWRTYGATPFKQREHLERLFHSAQQIDLTMPGTIDELEAIANETLARNGHPQDVTVRIIVTGGESTNFLVPEEKPSLAVILAPAKKAAAHLYQQGANLIVVEQDRFMPTVKSLNYLTAVMMQKRIKAAGAIEALFHDRDGYINECCVSNFLLFRGDQLITPKTGVLAGVTRNVALELAEDRFEVVMRPIHFSEIVSADEVFITSTTKEIMPIVQVGDTTIGTGVVGERTKYLMELFKMCTMIHQP